MAKRPIDIAVISDVHLGTYGCQSKELVKYLKSIQPGKLVLNGDIIDIWQFSKRYWPKSHMQVLKEIVKIMAKDTPVYYLTGNHDEMLRKFTDFSLGNFHLIDQLDLEINGERIWLFHGDVFDASIQHAKWLAKIGGWGYDVLIMINSLVNWILSKMGRSKMSLSKAVKNSVKKAVSYISDFESTAAEMAASHGYKYVACGHIHQPQIREVETEHGKIVYLNSGDWIENLSALEYYDGKWHLWIQQSEKNAIANKNTEGNIKEKVNKKKTVISEDVNPELSTPIPV